MGKGDRKTRLGKLWRGSHGKRRPKKKTTPVDNKASETPQSKSKPKRKTQRKKTS